MKRFSTGIFVSLLSGAAVAATEPESIPVGGAELIPTIQIKHSHNDNIFSSAFAEESSTITNLTPRIEYLAERDEDNLLSVTYDGDWARYWQSRDDDYFDHTLALVGKYSGNSAARFTFDASTAKLHDNRGEGASEGVGGITRDEPDEYDENNVGLRLDLGNPDARFGAMFSARQLDIEYTNNRQQTQFRDRDDREFEAKLFARISGKTRGFVGYRNTDIEYGRLTASGITLDSDESSVLAGVEWEISGKTTGTLEVGELTKDFDETGAGEEDLTVWDLGLTWTPREYSIITFSTSRDAAETNGIGAYIEKTDHSLGWNHEWSDRFQTSVSVLIGEDEYPGTTREDDRDDYTISANYDWQRWLNVGLGLQYSERDSNFDLFDYDRRIIFATIDLSL
ncbi:MAG: outer membrane beta-barrel protein [Pseudomonadales bacterium]|nr:outer membrane beta-barrel protein [Pseudomonadales bacterium]MBO6595971.1 outer membrane beta-barrel protein [Pseudomonadales bacterium]MBO6822454.1 outer membrane beta-barrel protein [Pseudomonadales bacterium]